jgi:hypothetical protein
LGRPGRMLWQPNQGSGRTWANRLSGDGGCSRRLLLDGLPGAAHRSGSPPVARVHCHCGSRDSRGTVRFCLWRNGSRSCLVLRLVGRVCLGALPTKSSRIVGMLTEA